MPVFCRYGFEISGTARIEIALNVLFTIQIFCRHSTARNLHEIYHRGAQELSGNSLDLGVSIEKNVVGFQKLWRFFGKKRHVSDNYGADQHFKIFQFLT